jgi:pilus assembly protein CpaB
MHYPTCAELLGSVRNKIRTPGPLDRRLTPLRLGLIAAITSLLLGWGLWNLLQGLEGNEESQDSSILVAQSYIPPFSAVKQRQAVVKEFPRGFVPPGAFHALNELVDDNGRPRFFSTVAIPEGQPVTRALLTDIEKGHGMASLLEPGHLAVSFAADRVRGAGGWIVPGDTIALFLTRKDLPGGFKKVNTITQMIFPALQVLSVNNKRLDRQALQMKEQKSPWGTGDTQDESDLVITVSLNLIEAPRLIAAQEQGHLTVALRSLTDDLLEVPHAR